jgi:hypothetical protein
MPQVQPSEEIMERKHFDRVTRHIATAGSRRSAVRALAATAVGLAALVGGHQDATEARYQHKKHKRGTSPAPKGLKEVCTPGVDTCSAGLRCDTPTTRHTCSSRVQGSATGVASHREAVAPSVTAAATSTASSTTTTSRTASPIPRGKARETDQFCLPTDRVDRAP